MSGGHFDYEQYKITQIADEIEHLILTNDSPKQDEYGQRIGRGYPPQVIEQFSVGLRALREAAVFAQRIDWLVSGDDGVDRFLSRLIEDLNALKGPPK